jgi:hypothetical protein
MVLTPPAKEATQMISKALHLIQVTQIDFTEPLNGHKTYPNCTTVTGTWALKMAAFTVSGSCTLIPFHTLISSLIVKDRLHAWQLFGLDPDIIVVPFTKTQVSWLFQLSKDWQIVQADFSGQI